MPLLLAATLSLIWLFGPLASDETAPESDLGQIVAALPETAAAPDDASVRDAEAAPNAAAADSDTAIAHQPDEIPTATLTDGLIEPDEPIGEERRVIRVASGDTILSLLTRESVPRDTAHAAVDALQDVFDPRRLQIGQEVTLLFDHRGGSSFFQGLELMPDVESVATVSLADESGDFVTAEQTIALETMPQVAVASIESSLAAAGDSAGVPYEILVQAIRAYSYDVDFQRDIHPGDAFEILFDQDFLQDGTVARNGDVRYAQLTLSGTTIPIYRFRTEDGVVDFYAPDGVSIRRALMRTPIDGARLSSGFGMRRHPILGYSRMHRGTDFAAPTGTPIYAAGDGVIDFIGNNRGYGRYIRIRHNSRLQTAYAHMNGFARGLGNGDRVEQGQVIGYVGSTGLSTGPHLHYEVLIEGRQVNPMRIDLPTGRSLEGDELAAFQAHVRQVDEEFHALRRDAVQVASARLKARE